MDWNNEEGKTLYKVVVNHEEQYSIWPVDRENPPGWREVGVSGPKEDCLAYIKEVWTDMRPLSLRKKMEQLAQASYASPEKPGEVLKSPETLTVLINETSLDLP